MNNLFFLLVFCGILILSAHSIHRKKEYSTSLSVETSICLKGIAAVLVVMHHVQQQNVLTKYYLVFGYIGFILVGTFLFLSGYGLAYGFYNKEGYMKGFLPKHLLSIYIPYWFVLILDSIVHLVFREPIDVSRFILSLMGFGRHWFVTAILLFYVFFYLVFLLINKNSHKQLGICVCVLGYMLVCTCCGLLSSYTASSLCFVLGVIYYLHRDRFAKIICNRQIFLGGLFFLLFFGRLGLSYIGITNNLLHIGARNLVSCCFVIFLMSVFLKYDFFYPFWMKTGKMSYEIFLAHGFLLPLIKRYNLLVFFVVTIISAVLLWLIAETIKGKIMKIWK